MVTPETADRMDTIEPADVAAADDAPPIAERAEPPSVEPRGVLLRELRPNSCLYAIAEPEPRQHRFCGRPVNAIGSSWCAAHRALCYATTITVRSAPQTAQEPP
jgi:hypothetical protein